MTIERIIWEGCSEFTELSVESLKLITNGDEKRVKILYRAIVHILTYFEGDRENAKAWFLTANPELAYMSPVELFIKGRFVAVEEHIWPYENI